VRQAENSGNWVAQSRSRLALRRAEKPATKAGQIRALWPEIEAALHGVSAGAKIPIMPVEKVATP
jgi:hypothetical protein